MEVDPVEVQVGHQPRDFGSTTESPVPFDQGLEEFFRDRVRSGPTAAVPAQAIARVTPENPFPAEWIALIGAEDVLRDNALGGLTRGFGFGCHRGTLSIRFLVLIMFDHTIGLPS